MQSTTYSSQEKKGNKELLGLRVNTYSKTDILDNIGKYISSPTGFFHIISLNPENLVISSSDAEFKEIVKTAQIKITDGFGVVIASKILGVKVGDRVTGVGLMEDLLDMAGKDSLAVMLIGAKHNLAVQLAECYNEKYGQKNFFGIQGIEDIQDPKKEEEEEIFSIVASVKPRFLFVAFGSPYQEKWLWKNRALLQGIICMGVGGAFDYLAGEVKRPPKIVGILGLEWLFRLLHQPWRWRRQLRLIKFAWLVVRQKISSG